MSVLYPFLSCAYCAQIPNRSSFSSLHFLHDFLGLSTGLHPATSISNTSLTSFSSSALTLCSNHLNLYSHSLCFSFWTQHVLGMATCVRCSSLLTPANESQHSVVTSLNLLHFLCQCKCLCCIKKQWSYTCIMYIDLLISGIFMFPSSPGISLHFTQAAATLL